MRCIFCKEPSDTSKSIEHIIPESIGSKRLVLPVGMVCDKCNNYFARKVEKPVLSHRSMRNVRGWYQVPTKKGKIPSLEGHIGGTDIGLNMKRLDGKLKISAEKGRDELVVKSIEEKMRLGLDHPALIFPIEIDPPQKAMSRFLAKMALEAIAFRHIEYKSGNRVVEDPYFERIRRFARYGGVREEWPYHRRMVFPMDTEMRHPETRNWVQAGFGHEILKTSYPETYFVFLLYGVEFAINLGGPAIKGYKAWLEENDQISPILKRMNVNLVTRRENMKDKHYLEGPNKI